MSYILEALRKVEQQREQLPTHGLSSRRRYYSALDARTWPRSWVVVIAVVAGATLSGSVVAYFSADSVPLETAQPQQPPVPAQYRPASVASVPASANLPVYAGANQTKRAPPPLQTAHAAPLRMPGPRYQPQGKPAMTQNTQPAVTQSAQPAVSSPVDKPETSPEQQEKVPETRQPDIPPPEKETEVASVHPPSNGVGGQKIAPAVNQGRGSANSSAMSADNLGRISPPKAVVVQPFRPNDVIRPPAARQGSPTGEAPLLSTLSSQFQSMVPKMTINAQVYSSAPNQRFVVINMKRYNEGQNTAEGVSIISIRQQDIICAYQGQRFRLGR